MAPQMGDKMLKDANQNIIKHEPMKKIDVPGFDPLTPESQIENINPIVDAYFNNRFHETMEYAQSINIPGQTPYYSQVLSYMKFVNAIFTMEKDLIKECIDQCRITSAEWEKRRKPKKLSNWIFRQNYAEYTDEEAIAECLHGEISFCLFLMSLMDDPSFMALIKAALKLKSVYDSFYIANEISKVKKDFRNDRMKKTFEACHLLGWGIINMLLSHMPKKVLSLLSFVGFTTDVEVGKTLCRKLTTDHKGVFTNRVGIFAYCFYSFYAETFLSIGTADLQWVKEMTDYTLSVSPDSVFELFWGARTLQLGGDADAAIEMFTKCMNVQDEFKQIHNICNWDILWSYALKEDWKSAADVALNLSDNCNWSKATNMFQYGCFLYMMMEDTGDMSLKPKIRKAMEMVPELKKRMAGKSIPPEKYAVTIAKQYLDGDEDMGIPVMDLFYIWNIFSNTAGKPMYLDPMINRCNKKIPFYKENKNELYFNCLLMRGVCNRMKGQYDLAIADFQEIIEYEDWIKKLKHVPPHAAFEMGLTYCSLGEYDKSRQWLHRARDEYSGFLIETQVQIRIHAALQKVDQLEKQ